MRKNFLYRVMILLASALTIASCTNEAEEKRPQGTRALDVQVAVNPTSRAQVIGTSLPEGAKIGVNVTAADGSEYDGQNAGYLNVAYTATGTDGTQTWGSTAPVMLSGTEGKLYAYYPHTADVDYKAIEVNIASQYDWMVGAEAYTVSDKAPSVVITMNHAQTALNINVVRDNAYTGVGLVEALAITSEGLASEGTLDTRDGSWSAINGANTAISIISAPFTLDGTTLTNQENPYMFVPATDETKDFTVTATIDGKAYNVGVAMNEAFAPGKMYQLNVKVTNTGLTVSKVTLTDWVIDTTLPEGTLEPGYPNGVYAVRKSDDALILPGQINTATEEYIAVALVANDVAVPQKFMIEKNGENNTVSIGLACNADGVEYSSDFQWGPYNFNVEGIKDYSDLFSSMDIDADWNGKKNTLELIKVNTANYEADNHAYMATYCIKFNETSKENHGFTDWYIPAQAQLVLLRSHMDEINDVLTEIGGCTIASYWSYYSSSEYNSEHGWGYSPFDGWCFCDKRGAYRIRFIRDLE